MLRKSGLFLGLSVLLWGCDLFSTREFRSKPSDIRTLKGLSRIGDSVAFRATESVWKAGASSPEKILSRRRLVFTFLGDSLRGGDTLKVLSLRISDDSLNLQVEKTVRLVRFTGDGVVLEGTTIGGSARYFPLKTSSQEAVPSQPADSLAFPALPALLVEGWSDSRSMGILEVKRRQTSVDTLDYQGHSEEAWGVSETVLDGRTVIARGTFWYGASGLLRAEQTWTGFGWRSDNGAVPLNADANGVLPQAELRRVLERL